MLRYLLAALLLAASAPACARVQLEIGAGISHAGIRSNGTWYQQGLPHTLKTDAPAVEIDLRWSLQPDLDLITGVVDLGRYSSDSQDVPNDAAYLAHVRLPLAHYVGSGRLWGWQALIERRWGERWQIGIQAGPFLYRESWRMSVPNWYPSDPVGVRTWYAPRATAGGYSIGPVMPIRTSDQRWAIGAVVGVTLSHRGSPWALSLRYVRDGAKFSGHPGGWPPLWKSHAVLMIERRL